MKFSKLFGVGVLSMSVLALNAYGINLKPRLADKPAPTATAPAAPAAFGNTCADGGTAGQLLASGGTLAGDNSTGTDDYGYAGQQAAGECDENGGWGPNGLDQVIEFTVDTTGLWTFTTCPGYGDPGVGGPAGGSAGDSSLAITVDPGTGCEDSFIGQPLDCNGDGGANCPGFTSELVDLSLTAGTTYYLLVDAWSATYSTGPFVVAYQGPCTTGQDCTDREGGNFCTGAGICTAGVCTYEGDPCVGTALPLCDNDTGTCLACSATADPDATCGDDGDPCNGREFCNTSVDPAICDFDATRLCPDGLCQNGTCQTGICDQGTEACGVSGDCPFAAQGQTCIIDGSGSLRPCYDNRLFLRNEECGAIAGFPRGETCVSSGRNVLEGCVRDSCNIYSSDTSAYIVSGFDPNIWIVDDFTLPAAPAGRDVVSYGLSIFCRNGFGSTTTTGPFDITTAMWTVTDADETTSAFFGLPDAMVPDTICTWKGLECGNAISGDVNRSKIYDLNCDTPLNPTLAGRAGFTFPTNKDHFLGFQMTGDHPLLRVGASLPLSQGVIVGSSIDEMVTAATPGGGGVGWQATGFGGAPYDANHGKAHVCTIIVGSCCLGAPAAPGTCEMLSEADCTAANGSWSISDAVNPDNNCSDGTDGDGIAEICDNCPDVANIDQANCNDDAEGDLCEVDEDEQDRDFDGECNGTDLCPDDPAKIAPLQCGCGEVEDDTDLDGVADCLDNCDFDEFKVEPGICGCGVADVGDEDGDGVLDCVDQCRGVSDAVFAPECDGAIPTVSEWGLVILALLLLVAGKVYFGRRRAMA